MQSWIRVWGNRTRINPPSPRLRPSSHQLGSYPMSKSEILAALALLHPEERREVRAKLDQLDGFAPGN